jgi:hypothetical protein
VARLERRERSATTGLTSITFSGGYRVAELLPDGGVLNASDAGDAGDAGTSIFVAFIPTGPVAAVKERGKGRIFIWLAHYR